MAHLTISAPWGGALTLWEDGGALTGLTFSAAEGGKETPLLLEARAQLAAYFSGNLRSFSLPLAPRGTAFQHAVWNALEKIPYGETCSYAALAEAAGHPGACRAAGNANGKNPLPIFIPCHRVIRTGGAIGGYAGGLAAKKFLLELEKRYA